MEKRTVRKIHVLIACGLMLAGVSATFIWAGVTGQTATLASASAQVPDNDAALCDASAKPEVLPTTPGGPQPVNRKKGGGGAPIRCAITPSPDGGLMCIPDGGGCQDGKHCEYDTSRAACVCVN